MPARFIRIWLPSRPDAGRGVGACRSTCQMRSWSTEEERRVLKVPLPASPRRASRGEVAEGGFGGVRLEVLEGEVVVEGQPFAEGDGDGGFFPEAQIAFGDRGTFKGGPHGVNGEVL